MLDDESIDAEVDRLVQARLAGGAEPERLPAVGAGNLFKLKGSASGEQAAHVLRAKEVERRVDERLKATRKDGREAKKDERLDSDFMLADAGLGLFMTGGMEALKVDQIKAILNVHGKKPKGKKAELQDQLGQLLGEKTRGMDEDAALAQMQQLTAAAAAARVVNAQPIALPPAGHAAPGA